MVLELWPVHLDAPQPEMQVLLPLRQARRLALPPQAPEWPQQRVWSSRERLAQPDGAARLSAWRRSRLEPQRVRQACQQSPELPPQTAPVRRTSRRRVQLVLPRDALLRPLPCRAAIICLDIAYCHL